MTSGSAPKLEDFRTKLMVAERGNKSRDHGHENTKPGLALMASNSNKRQHRGSAGSSGTAGTRSFKGKCYWCQNKGHREAECQQRLAGKPKTVVEQDLLAASSALLSDGSGFRIIADSGAERHIISNMSWFKSCQKLDNPVIFGSSSGGHMVSTHVGIVDIEISLDGKTWRPSLWTGVHYVPDACNTALFSTAVMDSRGFGFQHWNGRMLLSRGEKPILGGYMSKTKVIPYIRLRQVQEERIFLPLGTYDADEHGTKDPTTESTKTLIMIPGDQQTESADEPGQPEVPASVTEPVKKKAGRPRKDQEIPKPPPENHLMVTRNRAANKNIKDKEPKTGTGSGQTAGATKSGNRSSDIELGTGPEYQVSGRVEIAVYLHDAMSLETHACLGSDLDAPD